MVRENVVRLRKGDEGKMERDTGQPRFTPEKAYDAIQMLIDDAANGDQGALNALLRTFHLDMRRRALTHDSRPEEADIFVNEAVVLMMNSFDEFTGSTHDDFLEWTERQVDKAAAAWQSGTEGIQRAAEVTGEFDIADIAPDTSTVAEQETTESKIQAAKNAIEKLPPHLRQVIELSYYDNQSLAEIAAGLNTTEDKVATTLNRAKKNLHLILRGSVADTNS